MNEPASIMAVDQKRSAFASSKASRHSYTSNGIASSQDSAARLQRSTPGFAAVYINERFAAVY
jgi:hypothetical protein